MRNKAVTEEFKVEENLVVHVPTNAKFSAYPGSDEIHVHNPGNLGSVLPNGDDYDEDSVWVIARQLMKERLR